MPDVAHLRLSHVIKRFGAVTAVDDVSFDVPKGAFATLLGPSGCGKTTTLRMIAGFYDPDEGDIVVSGRRINDLPAHRRGTAMVFQDYALFPHMSVRDNVGYGLGVQGVPAGERAKRIEETLAFVGLGGLGDRMPSQLSGGQQQRVAVARALIVRPEILLLDEPLSNLDARLRRQMREEIRELQQRLSLTVVYVTHDQSEAMAVSDRIIVMNRATIAQEGAPRELYEQPRDPFVAGFMGDANRVRGVLARRNGTHGEVTLGAATLSLPHRGLPEGDVELSIRPESITLRPPGTTPLAGTIRKAAYLGGIMEYTLESGIGPLFAVSTAVDRPYAVGDGVSIELARHGVVLIPPGRSDDAS